MAKSKFQKKKDREREVRKKILNRRERKHAIEKEKAAMDAEEKAVRHKERPIRNEEFYAARKIRDQEIRMKLEDNLKLLEGLQKEYEAELEKRKEYVEKLQQAGHKCDDTTCEACEKGEPYVDIEVPPEELLREDGTLISPEELPDKPNLTEKASTHLNEIYEKWRIKKKK